MGLPNPYLLASYKSITSFLIALDRKNDRRKLIRAENKRKRLSDVNFEALPPLSPIFESSNVIPLPAGEIFEAETDCVKFEKGTRNSQF